ncbi:MAG TPA: hypothetical protein VLH79_09480 [Chthonomonadales bacterium]|nr:hypothetical protein [Chthonomonadales bacterium]
MSRVWLALLVGLLTVFPAGVGAGGPARTVVVLVEGIGREDLEDPRWPALRRLASDGAIGLLHTAAGPGPPRLARFVAVATGSRERSEPSDAWILRDTEQAEGASAGVVLQRRSGVDWRRALPGAEGALSAALLHLGIGSLARRDLLSLTPAAAAGATGRPGVLAVVGDAPIGSPARAGALLAMGEEGVAPVVLWADQAVGPDEDRRIGHRLGYAAASDPRSVVVVVGAGLPRERALARVDACLAAIASRSAGSGRVLLVSVSPPPAERLAVAVLASEVERGLLTSATTRTAGLITLVDVAPSVREWLGLPRAPLPGGHAMRVVGDREPAVSLAWLDRKVASNAGAFVPGLAVLGAIAGVLGFGAIWLLLRGRTPGMVWALMLVWLVQTPVGLLVVAALPGASLGVVLVHTFVAMTVMASLAFAAAARGGRDGAEMVRAALCWSAAALFVVAVADSVAGHRLMPFSVLSPYLLAGIRFYGIGNEYAACLIGFALLWAFLGRLGPWRAAALFAAVALLIGWPALGANAGGAAAAIAGFVAGLWALTGRRVGLLTAAAAALAGVAAAVGLAVADDALAAAGGSATHLGDAVRLWRDGGWAALAEIASRKVAMNARLVVDPAALAAFGWFAVVGAVGARAGRRVLRRLSDSERGWAGGVRPVAVAASAAFAFNDSGVVAALFVLGAMVASGLALACVMGREGASTAASPEPSQAPA